MKGQVSLDQLVVWWRDARTTSWVDDVSFGGGAMPGPLHQVGDLACPAYPVFFVDLDKVMCLADGLVSDVCLVDMGAIPM